jgi:septal ring factor EnvC (AmiA/AmiB activator)
VAIAALLGWGAGCAVAAAATRGAGGAPADRKVELQRLQERIGKLQAELARSEKAHGETVDALRATERSISEANRVLSVLGGEQRELDQELARLDEAIAANRADTEVQRALLERLVRQHYRSGDAETSRLLLEGRRWDEVERQMHYLGYVGRERSRAMERLRLNAAQLSALLHAQRSKQQALAANVAEQRKARDALQSERAARQKVLSKVRAEIAKGRKEIGRLKRDEERLSLLIERLSKALQSHREDKSRSGETIDVAADAALAGRAFESLRGRLRLPVRGELRGRFGSPREEGGVTWKGLFIKTDAGQPVRAVADGMVVYADWVRGFGNLLVVDHGGGYLSVYGNNESLLKQVGERVTSGENLATAGNTGGAQETGVYFELRHEGKPFDPMRWVAR